MTDPRTSFDHVADIYDAVRPTPPRPAIDALCRGIALSPASRLVEVGPGTGQLTRELLARGAHITALEPGAQLLARCAKHTEGRTITLEHTTFEAWAPDRHDYTAVIACQAAHWIDPSTFIAQSAACLDPRGCIALLWTRDLSAQTPFWHATQPLYARYIPDRPSDIPKPSIAMHVSRYEAALDFDERFARTATQAFPWQRDFDSHIYADLLRTQSNLSTLSETARNAFIDGHTEIIRKMGGRITRIYDTALVLAKRRAGSQGE